MDDPHLLTLDLGLIRWSVMCDKWNDLAQGSAPQLGPFLAGWFTRAMGAEMPSDLGMFRDSYRVGWREADTQISIQIQSTQP